MPDRHFFTSQYWRGRYKALDKEAARLFAEADDARTSLKLSKAKTEQLEAELAAALEKKRSLKEKLRKKKAEKKAKEDKQK